jgi:hypothetical protein
VDEPDDFTALSGQVREDILRDGLRLLDAGTSRWSAQVVTGKPESRHSSLPEFFNISQPLSVAEIVLGQGPPVDRDAGKNRQLPSAEQ